MIDVYVTKVEAVDEDKNVLFTLETQDAHCCIMEIKRPMLLSNDSLEETLTAVRRGVHLLKLED